MKLACESADLLQIALRRVSGYHPIRWGPESVEGWTKAERQRKEEFGLFCLIA